MINTWYENEAQFLRVTNQTKRWDWHEWGEFAKGFIRKFPKLMSYPTTDGEEEIRLSRIQYQCSRSKFLRRKVGDMVFVEIKGRWFQAKIIEKNDSYRSSIKNWMLRLEYHDGEQVKQEWVEGWRIHMSKQEEAA